MMKKQTILIADDETGGREILAEMLADQDYEFLFAASGEEAVANTMAFRPDLILLDIMMPRLSGFEVCRFLRAEPTCQHIPIILVTALDGEENLVRGIDAGADDFLHKPVNRLELQARVRSMLRIKLQYDELNRLLQIREDLANMIVHDIRNPLTIIYGTAQNMRERAISAREIRDTDKLVKQVRRLELFMNDLLSIAKMEQGHMVVNQTETDINDLIHNVHHSYEEAANLRQIKLVSNVSANPCHAAVDQALFERVLDNLVVNALKYSPANSTITLLTEALPEVRPQAEQRGHCKVRVQVLDEGFGIPPEYRDVVFNKYGVVAAQDANISQIGLGLSFCKMVVDAHGGAISITDNKPSGTIFTVDI